MPPKKKTSSKKKKKAASAQAKPPTQAVSVSGDGGRVSQSLSPPGVVVPDQISAEQEMVLDELVERLWPNFVPASMSSDPELLKRYLKPVLFGVAPDARAQNAPAIQSEIAIFVVEALYSGHMAERMVPNEDGGEPFPLLALVCQWKLLRTQFGFHSDDDLVEIVLKRGANVNDRLVNGTNALFFAVKYGTIRTVDLLLKAGIDFKAVDYAGRTCLRNALEHPQPDIVERLLQILPATEMFPGELARTAADELLNNFTAMQHDGAILHLMPTSWLVLGRPSVDNIARALMIVLRKGSEFTDKMTLSYAFSGIKPIPGDARYEHLIESSKELKIIMSFLFGKWLPDPLQQEVVAFDLKALTLGESISVERAKDDCAICHSKNDDDEKPRKKIELYCGHWFCLECIVDYGKRHTRAGCPTCRRLLCLELCSTIPSGHCSAIEMFRLHDMETIFPRGPFAMNEEQVLRECRARKISAAGNTIDELRHKLFVHQNVHSACAELCATRTQTFSGGTLSVAIAPKDGLVVIPIVIKSIPVLAFVSARSPFTTVSREFVTTFGLKKKNLTTDRFRDFTGKRNKNSVFTALHAFEFTMGGISVQLDSAVEAQNFQVGIQLGFDFLKSFAYCVFDIETDNSTYVGRDNSLCRTFMRLDNCGGFQLIPNIAESEKEEMRFYAKTGKSFASKVLKIKPLEDMVLTCSLAENATVDECHWCCRLFPYGMQKCPKCPEELFYCDKECLTKAWPVHRLRPAHSNS